MFLKERFFPESLPTEKQLVVSRRYILAENAVANTIASLGTGNFLMGYLAWMGASPAFSALVGALPMLGCVLQAVSPFLFERLRYRKLCIVLVCFGFRFSMGLAAFVPVLLHTGAPQLGAMFALYFIAYMFAGFVTPGLNRWILGSAPEGGRGHFFAKRNILSAIINAGITVTMGFQLDHFIELGQPHIGYFIVYGSILIFSLVDAVMLSKVCEFPSEKVLHLKPKDFLRPFQNKTYRPIILFDTLWFIASNFSSAFLPVYLLQGLGLSHSYISAMTIVSSAASIVCNWIWGRMADRRGWRSVLTAASTLACCGYAGWFLVTPSIALVAVPILQCITTAGSTASSLATLNLEYVASPQEGKTVYLGAVAVVSNLLGYAAAVTASGFQSMLQSEMGVERSISVLFAISALAMLVCLWHARRNLPHI